MADTEFTLPEPFLTISLGYGILNVREWPQRGVMAEICDQDGEIEDLIPLDSFQAIMSGTGYSTKQMDAAVALKKHEVLGPNYEALPFANKPNPLEVPKPQKVPGGVG